MSKTKILQRIIIMCVMAVTLTVSCLAFSYAWYQDKPEKPYMFEIYANGVLYVYIESKTVDNEEYLYPAVAMPGAVAEGLYMDVLTEYDSLSANPSYIEKAASVTTIKGQFTVFNEGEAEVPVPLPQDSQGYTLYPDVTTDGHIKWINPSDHSQGWQTTRMPIHWTGDPAVPDEWDKEVGYEPLLDDDDEIVWKESYAAAPVTVNGADYYYGKDRYEQKLVPKEGSSEATVYLDLSFKASDDDDLDDYYDPKSFVVKRLYLTTVDEEIPVGVGMGAAYHNSGVRFDTISQDKTSATFKMFGLSDYYIHAEVYLAQPDELMDPELRGKDVYLRVGVSVAVTQFGD